MAERSIANSIANTFHLDPKGNSIFARDRHRRMAIELEGALDTIKVWVDYHQKNNVASSMTGTSWASVVKYTTLDIATLNKLAQKGDAT